MFFKVFVQRGMLTESIHTAKCLVKNSNFKTILSSDHNKDLVYPRSAIKIFQAIPFINLLFLKNIAPSLTYPSITSSIYK